MRIIILFVLLCSLLSTGCLKKSPVDITERDFNVIWKEYSKAEFEESFDEKQSAFQRQQLLKSVLSRYNLDLDDFKAYMKLRHGDQYRKIFQD